MKYLKPYKIFESESYLDNESINWDLINDAKDLALDYLDGGLELEYKIDYNGLTVLSGVYSHNKDKQTWSGSKFENNVELDNEKLVVEKISNYNIMASKKRIQLIEAIKRN